MDGHRWLVRALSCAVSVILLTGPQQGRAAFQFVEHGTDDFEIVIDGVSVFRHTEDNPMMYVGTGNIRFVDSQGNFRVDDYVTSRAPLMYSTMTYNGPNDTVSEVELYYDWDIYLKFRIFENEQGWVQLQVFETGSAFDRFWVRLVAEENEHVYGGGEQFSFLDLRGRNFPIWNTEQGIGRNMSEMSTFWANQDSSGAGGDYYTTYFAQPTFLSSRGYMFHNDGLNYVDLDFSHPDYHELLVHGAPHGLLFATSNRPDQLVTKLTDFLGRQPPLPDWMLTGAILGLQGGTQMLQGYLTQAEAHSIPVSAVWIQDWVGSVTTATGKRLMWNWQWNEQQYPGLPEEINKLKEKGIRVLGIVAPFLEPDGELFTAAEARGYLVKTITNQTYLQDFGGFECGAVDLTNPGAYSWFKNTILKTGMIDFGLGGWMAVSFSEYLPVQGVVYHSGIHPEDAHTFWPVLWAKLNRETVEEKNKLGDVVFWTRAGYSGVGNYSLLMWAGNQNADLSLSDGLASTIPAALSMGVSGVGLTHADIGGYDSFPSFTPPLLRTEECLLRSAELAVFTPVFRTHEGSKPSASVQYYSSRGTLLKFARLARMFASLHNYRRHVINVTASTGLPAQRPLFLQYPNDPASYDVTYQYLFGPDLLVAPVYLPDVETWDVYLPPDPEAEWIFLWDETVRSSGSTKVKVNAPLGKPPVFYRSTSGFVTEFQQLTQEPLVDIPPYMPDTKPGEEEEVKPIDTGEDVPGGDAALRCNSATGLAPSLIASLVTLFALFV